VKTLREQIQHKQDEEYAFKVVKIHQDIELSNVKIKQRRRAEIINEQKKLTKSVNHNKDKKIKDDNVWHEKIVKEFEEKDFLIDKVRKEVKEIYEQKSHYLGMKIQLRKKDQEENLNRIKLQKLKEKHKILNKILDNESLNRSRQDVDMNSVRAQAEKEFRTRISVHKKESEIVLK
jgi:hypothetical protein